MDPAEINSAQDAAPQSGIPSRKSQSWGAVVSIIIIMLMIIVGAFYSWGQRISQETSTQTPSAAQ